MKRPQKSTMLAGAALALAVTAVGAGVITASAQTATSTSTTRTNPMSSLVSAIATKFNLNTADVQSVIDSTMQADRAARDAERQQQIATDLAKVVTDGKLTQAQADLITAKASELKSTMEADRTVNQSLTLEEMKAKMDAQRTALTSWATANNIPTEYLRFVGGGKGFGGGHGGRGGFGGFDGQPDEPAPTTSTSSTITQ